MSNRTGEKNLNELQQPCSTPLRSGQGHLDLSCLMLTLSQAHRLSIEERPVGHLSRSLERLRHLPGGGLRIIGMPHEGYADPIMNDEPRFHSDMPVSELTEHVTRAFEVTLPIPTFLFHCMIIHSSILMHASIHSSKHCICN